MLLIINNNSICQCVIVKIYLYFVDSRPEIPISPSTTVPETPRTNRAAGTDWTPGCCSDLTSGSSHEDLFVDTASNCKASSAVQDFNESVAKIAAHTPSAGFLEPLESQLTSTWEEAEPKDKNIYKDIASDACRAVCELIAPKDGQKLFEEIKREPTGPTDDLIALMCAYRDAQTRNVKMQILSIYAYRHTMKKLQAFHEPYEKLSMRQIKLARSHAQKKGPGSAVPKMVHHRVRLDTHKVDHFIDFINRPYFYQDVAFGTRTLTLDEGSKMTMPNIIRTVTRSTMVMQYQQYCKEEAFEPISRSTMYRILEVREASQRKSLCGLDNISAEGVSAFGRLSAIMDELCEVGANKEDMTSLQNRLNDGMKYLKTTFKRDCMADESECADHCRRFALSDPNDQNLKQKCSHSSHYLSCKHCQELKLVLDEIEASIKNHPSNLYGTEQRDDLMYDFSASKSKIFAWKCHLIRGVNQEQAKQEAIRNLTSNSALIVIDWAMKFNQMWYREKQSEWYGKRGLSWHISSVVTYDVLSKTTRVLSYAHLIDSCSQDWFAVTSVFESLLESIKVDFPDVKTVCIRSDEAGCYHTTNLIAAVKDVGDRVGIHVERYDFSEPQQGKDICDRVLCPMKASIRKYCAEGNNILNASDMRKALKERPVKGTTAAVSILDESSQNLEVHKIKYFSELHNFKYEEKGVRTWKSYDIGLGKVIPWESLYVEHQGPTNISLQEGQAFFNTSETRKLSVSKDQENKSEDQPSLFVCPEAGCSCTFDSFSEFELHIEVGLHDIQTKPNETFYDGLRRDWVAKFSSVDTYQSKTCSKQDEPSYIYRQETPSPLSMGWALKSRTASTRFSENVRSYLTAKFDLGERTGKKADSEQVVAEMRCARNENNGRRFEREEWLSKTQIAGFFSRLSASRKRSTRTDPGKNVQPIEENEEDIQDMIWESERLELMEEIDDMIGLQHPIIYDAFDLCDYYHRDKIAVFNIAMLKKILNHFEVQFKSKDLKSELVRLVCEVIKECKCSQ